MATAISYALQPQDNPRGPRKFNHPPGGKTSKGECFKCQSTGHWAQKWQKEIPGPCLVCRQVIRSEPVQTRRGRSLPILRWLCWMTEVVQGFWQLPSTRCPISIKEPRVVCEVAGKKTSFLIDMRATYSILISYAGPLSSESCTMTDINGNPHTFLHRDSHLSVWTVFGLVCLFGCAWVSYPTSGRNSLGSLRAILWFGVPEQPLFLTLTKTNQLWEQGLIASHILYTVNLPVWDKGIPEKAINIQPVKISLNPEVAYPNKKQDPLKLEAKKGLPLIINKFLKHGLLVLYPSPGSAPILPVVKPNKEYRMVPDLQQ